MKIYRFALLSHVLPPSPSGQAVMLYRILVGVNPALYYLMSRESYVKNASRESSAYFLPVHYFRLDSGKWLYWLDQLESCFICDFISILLKILSRAIGILRTLRLNPTMALIACSGDIADIPAGFLASRMAKIPFFAYLFDDYVHQWTGNYRLVAKWIAPFIFKRSVGVIGPNELICEEYQRRYGVAATLVRNPCDEAELSREPLQRWPAEDHKIKIIYTGALYHVNFDCFSNLIQTMGTLPEYNLELHIYTAQTQSQLESIGISGERIFIHSHVPYNRIVEEQRKADILFLPLAFNSPIPMVIRTSAPGKMGEYLASGRPVLAHVRSDTFVAYYFRKYRCGGLVDQYSSLSLAAMIKKLILDGAFRFEITQNARRQAGLDFSPELARNQLLKLLYIDQITENFPT